MQAGFKDGMQTLNQALRQLIRDRSITFETALAHTSSPQELAQLMGREANSAVASL